MTQFDIQDKERNKMTEAMMERDDREVIRLVQENRDAMGDALPTRRGFVRMPRIVEEEPAAQAPMDEDRELERLVNANTAWHRQQEEAAMEEEQLRRKHYRELDRGEVCMGRLVRRGAAALTPALLGTAVLGGMAQGWAEPIFAGLVAGICFVWALARLRRVIRGGG